MAEPPDAAELEGLPERPEVPPSFAAYGAEDARLLRQAVEVARAAAACFHPRRLILGLFLLLVLVETGRLYDRSTEPRFGPEGLKAEDPERNRAEGVRTLWRVLLETDPSDRGETQVPVDPPADSATVREIAAGVLASLAMAADEPQLEAASREAVVSRMRAIEASVPRGTFASAAREVEVEFGRFCRSVIELQLVEAAQALRTIALDLPLAIWRHDRLFLLGFGLPAVVIGAFFGGMLARLAACRFGRREWITLGEAADFASQSTLRLVSAPLLPLVVAIFPLGLVLLLGYLLRVPFLDGVGGILFGIPVALAVFAAVLVLGLATSWALVVPAVACEDADAADCVQRAYAAMLHRPGRMVVLLVGGLLGLAVGVAVLDAVIVVALALARGALEPSAPSWVSAAIGERGWLAFGSEDADPTLLAAPWAADAVAIWSSLLRWLVGGFVLAWLFDAGTRVYLYLREQVDGTRPEAIAVLPDSATRADRIREAIEASRRGR